MIKNDKHLAGSTPQKIIRTIENTKDVSRHERDNVLAGLFSFVGKIELASRIILQSLKPQVAYLTRITHFADLEERTSTIMSFAAERIMSWRPKTSEFCHLSLYRFIFKRTMNMARKWENWATVLPDSDYETVLEKHTSDKAVFSKYESLEPDSVLINFLIEWVADLAKIDQQTAEMVVMTRGGFSSVRCFSDILGLNPKSLRQRRLRVEQELKRKLSQQSGL